MLVKRGEFERERYTARRGVVHPMRGIIFWGVVASLLIYYLLLIFSIARPQRRFWPPPDRPSWRREVMRIAGGLGPVSVVGGLLLGALAWNSFNWRHWTPFVVGG